jgi:flagellar hook assembly protein FlgD
VNNGGVGISEAGIQNGVNFNVYPNPATNSSIVSFILPVSSNVKLSVYNMSGQLVSTLLDKKMDKGNHQINWNTTNYSGEKLSPGIYLLKLETGSTIETTKLIVK